MTFSKRKILKELFHWEPPVVGVTYSLDAKGEPDIDKMVEQKPFWKEIKTSSTTKPKSKKIIITDWSTRFLKTKPYPFWLDLIKEGLDAGAEFYVWTGALTLVKNFGWLAFELEKVEPITYKDLAVELNRQKIAQDEVEIIDFIRAQELKEKLDWNSFFLGKTNTPQINLKTLSENGIGAGYFQMLAKTFHPKLPLEVTFNNADQIDLLNTAFSFSPQVNSLVLDLESFTNEEIDKLISTLEKNHRDYTKLETLRIKEKLSADQLERLVVLFPNLEELILDKCGEIPPAHTLNFNLSKLKRLKILETKLPPNVIEPLVNSASNLEQMILFKCSVNGTFRLKSLKKLNIYEVEIEDSVLTDLIDNNTQLIELNVAYIKEIKSLKIKNQHPDLKKIFIAESIINNQNLDEFLSNCPNLENLTLTKNNYNSISASLNELTHLDLTDVDIDDDALLHLLSNSPNITSIVIKDCKNLTGSFLNKELPSLKNIRLYKINLENADITNILRHCKDINLSECKMSGVLFSNEDFNNVENLRIFKNAFDQKSISKLLASCPNLKELTFESLEECKLSSFTTLDLPNLTHLSLSPKENFKNTVLNKFFWESPKLEVLELDKLDNDFFDAQKLYFNKDTKLKIRNKKVEIASLSDDELKAFLLRCEGLEELNLRNSKNTDFYDKDMNLSAIKTLNFADTDISAKCLAQLLVNCPNLTDLDLTRCDSVWDYNDSLFKHIMEESSSTSPTSTPFFKLEKLNISLSKIDGVQLELFLSMCPAVNEINIYYTSIDPEYDLASVREKNPELKIITLPAEAKPQGKPKVVKSSDKDDSRSSKISSQSSNKTSKKPNVNIPSIHTGITPSSTEKTRFDANTGLSKDKLTVRQIFAYKEDKTPPPNNYRLQVRNKINLGNTIEFQENSHKITERNSFTKQKNIAEKYKNKYRHTDDVFLGEIKLPMQNLEWYPLPSLSANDEILDLSADVPLELGYCEDESLYYVRALTPVPPGQEVYVSFLLKADIKEKSSKKIDLDKVKNLFKDIKFDKDGSIIDNPNFLAVKALKPEVKLDHLVQFCRGFGDKELKAETNNDIESLNALINEGQGACRHRVWVFMALAQELGITARAVRNDCHIFVEVKQNGKWIKKDLGGHDAELDIKPMPKPAMPKKPKIPKPELYKVKESKKEINPPLRIQAPTTGKVMPPIQNNVTQPQPVKFAENPFNTWDTVKTNASNFKEYFDAIIKKAEALPANQRNILITVEPKQMELFHQYVTEYYYSLKKGCYYLDSLENVTEKAAFINEEGVLKRVDSAFIDFTKKAKPGDAIISNWSDYKSAFVGYNSMMDEERKVKTTPIPAGALVISVLDKTKAARMGEDFYSRFRIKSECVDLAEANLFGKLKITKEKETENFTKIEFFDDDWKKYLLGMIAINGKNFQIEEANLPDAIQKNLPGILLINAPWHLKEFRLFISELMIKRKFYFNGSEIRLPNDFQIKEIKKEHNFKNVKLDVVISAIESNDDYHLNTETLSNFFRTRRCENDLLFTMPGWLEGNKGKPISIYVTETLAVEQWAQLLSKAEEFKCQLQIKLAPNVTIPTYDMLKVKNIENSRPRNDDIIITNDLEFAEEIALNSYPEATVMSVNAEINFGTLFERTKPKNLNDDEWLFESTVSDVWKKLKDGEIVILKGTLSSALAKQLETLFNDPPYIWMNGKREQPKGRLILITDTNDVFNYRNVKQEKVTEEARWKLLAEQATEEEIQLLKKFEQQAKAMQREAKIEFSYGQLRAMFEKIKKRSPSNPFKPYFRLSPDSKLDAAKNNWDKKKDKKQFKNTVEKRNQKLKNEFEKSPFLFIAGASGVGKSTHILTELEKANCKVFVGIEKIKEWLEKPKEGEHVLFIDEANLEPDGAWDILEGLFNKKPGILLDGKFYPLSPAHKLIFAGNYNHFAGRHQHKFFERHGQVFNFKELPKKDIIELVIQPALKAAAPELNNEDIAIITEQFYKIYSEANKFFDNHPATLRNLKMMAMRFSVYLHDYKDILGSHMSLKDLASLAAVDELKGMVKNIEPFLRILGLNDLHCNFSKRVAQLIPAKVNDFIVTESRRNPLRALKDLFTVRDMQLKNKDLKAYNLPGFLIEGEAGIGKSKMAIEYLRSLGFTPGDVDHPMENGTRCYYHLTPTDPEKMERILVKAFHEGAVVIIDELNSLPLERILNTLMAGKDLAGKDPVNKGFIVIGTQNPATFTGRQVLSEALENRFNKIYLGEYPEQELREINYQICPNKEISDQIVTDFVTAKNYAKQHQKTPEPTPRDLFQHVAQVSKHPDFVRDVIVAKAEAEALKEEVMIIPPEKVEVISTKGHMEGKPKEAETKVANSNGLKDQRKNELPQAIQDEIHEKCGEGLRKILNLIQEHKFILHGGGVTEGLYGKSYSQTALNIKRMIESVIKNKKLTYKTFERIAGDIEYELGMLKKRKGFFGLGARDQTTNALYKEILRSLNEIDQTLTGLLPANLKPPKTSKEAKSTNDLEFKKQNSRMFFDLKNEVIEKLVKNDREYKQDEHPTWYYKSLSKE